MIRALAFGLALASAGAVLAQQEVSEANGAVLRALDRMSGASTDLTIASGSAQAYGKIVISVEDCRFPSGNPAGNAFAHVTVREPVAGGDPAPIFSGWMVAGSPALNALDHPRYDVWVLRCITS